MAGGAIRSIISADLWTKVRTRSFCHGLALICTDVFSDPSVRIREIRGAELIVRTPI